MSGKIGSMEKCSERLNQKESKNHFKKIKISILPHVIKWNDAIFLKWILAVLSHTSQVRSTFRGWHKCDADGSLYQTRGRENWSLGKDPTKERNTEKKKNSPQHILSIVSDMQLLLQCFDEYKTTHIFREASRMLAPKITLFLWSSNEHDYFCNQSGGRTSPKNELFFVIL